MPGFPQIKIRNTRPSLHSKPFQVFYSTMLVFLSCSQPNLAASFLLFGYSGALVVVIAGLFPIFLLKTKVK